MRHDSAVLDASGAYKLIEQQIDDSQLEILGTIQSPSIFWYEIGNISWKHLHFGSWKKIQAIDFIDRAMALTELNDTNSHQEILNTASAYNLNFYDATYLQLGLELDAVFVSFDKKLNLAANAAGLETYF